jgi:hypothetical protein
MQKSFVAFALAVFSLSAVSAAAQDAPQRSIETIRLPEPQRAAIRASTLPQAPLPFPRLASLYRRPDSVKDGLIKGALAGLLIAALIDIDMGEEEVELGARDWAAIIASGAASGLVIDLTHPSRQSGPRPGPQSPGIAAKVKLRF